MFPKTSFGCPSYLFTAAAFAFLVAAPAGVVSAQTEVSSQRQTVRQEPVPQQTTAAAPLGPLNPANWKLPTFKMPSFKDLLPGDDEKARIKKQKDGFFDEVTQSASKSWARTKEAFHPRKLNPAKFFTASASKPTEKKKPGFFGSLFAPAPPPRTTTSVTDFLSQKRP